MSFFDELDNYISNYEQSPHNSYSNEPRNQSFPLHSIRPSSGARSRSILNVSKADDSVFFSNEENIVNNSLQKSVNGSFTKSSKIKPRWNTSSKIDSANLKKELFQNKDSLKITNMSTDGFFVKKNRPHQGSHSSNNSYVHGNTNNSSLLSVSSTTSKASKPATKRSSRPEDNPDGHIYAFDEIDERVILSYKFTQFDEEFNEIMQQLDSYKELRKKDHHLFISKYYQDIEIPQDPLPVPRSEYSMHTHPQLQEVTDTMKNLFKDFGDLEQEIFNVEEHGSDGDDEDDLPPPPPPVSPSLRNLYNASSLLKPKESFRSPSPPPLPSSISPSFLYKTPDTNSLRTASKVRDDPEDQFLDNIIQNITASEIRLSNSAFSSTKEAEHEIAHSVQTQRYQEPMMPLVPLSPHKSDDEVYDLFTLASSSITPVPFS